MVNETRIKDITCMLTFLKMALKYCEPYKDIEAIAYDTEAEEVIVTFKSSCDKLYINVACDSNSAMLHDVEKAIYKYLS